MVCSGWRASINVRLNFCLIALVANSECRRRRVVEAYSGLNLTELTSDRLISLAGVASEFGTALGAAQNALQWRTPPQPAQYLCGLWQQDLARGLQWEIVDRRRRLVRVPEFPSWTWASLGRTQAGEGTDSSKIEAVAARWHTQWRRSTVEMFQVQEVRHVTGLTINPPRLDEARSIAIEALASDFGIENRFLALRISGQLRRDFCLKQAWPGGQKDLYRVAKLTANSLVGVNSTEASLNGGRAKGKLFFNDTWHQVTLLSGKGKAFGWASFDDTNLRVENTKTGPCVADDRPRPIYAFRVSLITKAPVWQCGLDFANM